MMMDAYGTAPTLIAVTLNILIAGLIFMAADRLMKWIGKGGAKAISKVAASFWPPFAVMMVRKGIVHNLS